MSEKKDQHWRRVFNTPYLGSVDITEPVVLTIAKVVQETTKTPKRKGDKEEFNVAYFSENELRPGEPLKPMILNATNCKTMAGFCGTHIIRHWIEIPVTIYVDPNVRQMGGGTGDGLKISTERPNLQKPELTPESDRWSEAVKAYKRDQKFDTIEKSVFISDANKSRMKDEAEHVA